MKHIETEIIIEVPIEKVWNVVMDFKAYPKWNPFIRSIKGSRKVGKRLQMELQTIEGRKMDFEPQVLKCSEQDEFRWLGKFGIRGIFDGEHYFAFESLGPSHTRFIHGEFFSGFLVGIMRGLLEDTRKSFELMNEALKLTCESKR